MNQEEAERFNKLFDCVAHEVAASGGDGWGTVVFKKTSVKQAADAFEAWKEGKAWGKWLRYRIESDGGQSVLFTDKSNENISFVTKDIADQYPSHQRGIGCGEIWLEVW